MPDHAFAGYELSDEAILDRLEDMTDGELWDAVGSDVMTAIGKRTLHTDYVVVAMDLRTVPASEYPLTTPGPAKVWPVDDPDQVTETLRERLSPTVVLTFSQSPTVKTLRSSIKSNLN
jgi:hypothetical protein